MKAQRGSSFTAWLIWLSVALFLFLSSIKIVGPYLEFWTVQTLVDDLAARTPEKSNMGTRQLRDMLNQYMSVNGLVSMNPNDFSVARVVDTDKKAIHVEYEVRRHWLANIDFLMNFEHTAEFGGAK